jgi:hypothetical protein
MKAVEKAVRKAVRKGVTETGIGRAVKEDIAKGAGAAKKRRNLSLPWIRKNTGRWRLELLNVPFQPRQSPNPFSQRRGF